MAPRQSEQSWNLSAPATIDTNVYISDFNYRGKPRLISDMAEMGLFRMDYSEPIVVETLRILRDKFHWTDETRREAESQMRRIGRRVAPHLTLDVVKDDPDDNRIVECAVEAKSDLIVTGDKDLLRLGRFGQVRIVTPAEFLLVAQSD